MKLTITTLVIVEGSYIHKRIPNRMGMARQSTLRGLYLANRNICYHDR